MKFLKLEARNIFSLGDVSIDLNKKGLLLIRGWNHDDSNENGAGKSSLASKALVWCLYGKTVGGVRGDKVINSYGNRNDCYARVEIESDNGSLYRVTRTRNPASLKLQDKNFVDISSKTAKDTQEKINKLLGRSFETFCQSEFFGQGRFESFFQLTPAAQTAAVQDILPMAQLDEWAEEAKLAETKIKVKIQQLFVEQKSKEYALQEVERQLEDVNEQVSTWNFEHENKLSKLNNDVNTLIRENGDIPEKISRVKIDLAQFDIEDFNVIPKLKQEIEASSNKVKALLLEKDKALKSLDEWKKYRNKYIQEQNRILGSMNSSCETCGQSIPETVLKKFSDRLLEIKQFLNQSDEPYKTNKKVFEDYEEKIKLTQTITENNRLAVSEFSSAQARYLTLMNKLNWLEERDISSDIKAAKLALENEKEKENPHLKAVSSLRGRENKIQKEIDFLNNKKKEIKKELEEVSFWKEAYSKGIKTFLLQQTCPFLERRTNQYLNYLGNSQLYVKFSTVKDLASGDSKDQFNVTVSSKTGGSEFDLLSGGEQQIVSFAVGLALADLAQTQTTGSSNIIILDEPFENLSPKNSEAVVNFLTTKLPKETVLLISNESSMLELIPNSILVEKKSGISTISSS